MKPLGETGGFMSATTMPVQMQRSRGEAHVALGLSGGRLHLGGLRQSGSAKVILPHTGTVPEAVFLNTSGGLTGDDSLSYSAEIGAGLVALATTQTAERAYRAAMGRARVRVDLTVGDGGFLDWLPQETILFDGSALDRRTSITLGRNAGCLLLEMVVLGRKAMGERVRGLSLRDWRQVVRDGAPLWVEPLVLSDRALQSGTAGLAGVGAFATLCLVSPDAQDLLGPVREVLDEPGVLAGASAMPGRLLLRAHAADGWPLRLQILRCLARLRGSRPLPRVWQM